MKWLFSFSLLLTQFTASAQSADYLLYFKDKQIHLEEIQHYLSPRTLEMRRMRGIEADEKDFPIQLYYIKSVANIAPISHQSKWLNAAVVRANQVQLESLKKLNFIREIEFLGDHAMAKKSTKQKLESQFAELAYGKAFPQINIHSAQTMHDSGFTGKGMRIAVFDNGFQNVFAIPAFQLAVNEGRLHSVWNYVDTVQDVNKSGGSHGTAVLSTMAGFIQDTFIGSAPRADYYLFKTENNASETKLEEINWTMAAEKADSIGVDVINSSLGYSVFDDKSTSYTYANMDGKTAIITKAANIAFDKGILVVSSAGNEGNDEWRYITAPADGPNVLTLGAVSAQRNIANFSSRGPSADGRIKPDVCAVGDGALVINEFGKVGYSSGTSFSSPIMAGLAACLWQMNPSLTNRAIRAMIVKSSDQLANPNNNGGYGIPDFSRAMQFMRRFDFGLYRVYPNPFSDYLIIEPDVQNNPKLDIEIFDLSGKRIRNLTLDLSKSVHSFGAIPTEDINKGQYFIRINREKVWKIQKN